MGRPDDPPRPTVARELSKSFMSSPRNAKCPCGSGLKWKKCCMRRRRFIGTSGPLEVGPPTPVLRMTVTMPLAEIAPVELPQVLFKYTQARFAKQLVTAGDLLVGTLEGYRSHEASKSDVGDADEGTQSRRKTIEYWDAGPDPSTQPEFDREFLRVDEPYFKIEGISLLKEARSPDCFIYAVSGACSLQVMERMDASYDACVAITDPHVFFSAIAETMAPDVTAHACAHCKYVPRHQSHRAAIADHPAVIKDPRFEYQDEYRLLLVPRQPSPVPKVISCPRAAACCKRVW